MNKIINLILNFGDFYLEKNKNLESGAHGFLTNQNQSVALGIWHHEL